MGFTINCIQTHQLRRNRIFGEKDIVFWRWNHSKIFIKKPVDLTDEADFFQLKKNSSLHDWRCLSKILYNWQVSGLVEEQAGISQHVVSGCVTRLTNAFHIRNRDICHYNKMQTTEKKTVCCRRIYDCKRQHWLHTWKIQAPAHNEFVNRGKKII